MFESFRVGHVPECESSEALPDIFNMDDDLEFLGDEDEAEETEEEATLF